MATKTKNNLPVPESGADVAAVVAPGTHVVGRLTGAEDVRVQGTVEGSVRLGATLFVEPEGVVLAEVYAHDVVVSGTIVGNITADHAIVLAASARVIGDLCAPRVSVEPGAAYRGSIATEAPAAEEHAIEAAARTYTAGRAPAARGALTERSAPPAAQANGNISKPARQAVRLPPRRAQAFTAAPTPARSAPAAPEDTFVVHHPTMRRSDPSPRKDIRPRALARGKHKVDRVD